MKKKKRVDKAGQQLPIGRHLLTVGPSGAERELDLESYQITLPLYERVAKFQSTIVVGRKGSGKTALKKWLLRQKGMSKLAEETDTDKAAMRSIIDKIKSRSQGDRYSLSLYSFVWKLNFVMNATNILQRHEWLKGRFPSELSRLHAKMAQAASDGGLARQLEAVYSTWAEEVGTEMSGTLAATIPGVPASAELTAKRSSTRKESHEKAETVEDRVSQLFQTVGRWCELVASASKDRKYCVVLDNIDFDWFGDEDDKKFIAALLDEAIIFEAKTKIPVIIFILEDIMEAAGKTRQYDKIRDQSVRLVWGKPELLTLIVKRIKFFFKGGGVITQETDTEKLWSTVFPGGMSSFDYVLSRTFYRPRDVINFVNEILAEYLQRTEFSKEELIITWQDIYRADRRWSNDFKQRYLSEYRSTMPWLEIFLKGLRVLITEEEYSLSEFMEALDSVLSDMSDAPDSRHVLKALYHTGAIGLTFVDSAGVNYYYLDQEDFELPEEIGHVRIHPVLYKKSRVADAEKA